MRARVRLWLKNDLSSQDVEEVIRRVVFLKGRIVGQSQRLVEAEFSKWGLTYRLVILRSMRQVDQAVEEMEDPSWFQVGVIFIHDGLELLSELVTDRFRRIFRW